MTQEGYTVFVVAGEFLKNEYNGELSKNQLLIPASFIRNNPAREQRNRLEESEIEKAIKMSLNENQSNDDDELRKAIAASLQGEEFKEAGNFNSYSDFDPELKAAIELSMQVDNPQIVVPEYEGADSFILKVKNLRGKIISKRFLPDCLLKDVILWIEAAEKIQEFRLIQAYPRTIYNQLDQSLRSLELHTGNILLIVEKKS